MAEAAVAPSVTVEEEDLSEEQIEQLLQQAESRLQTKALSLQEDDVSRFIPKRPKVELVPSMRPYIDTAGEIAHADGQRLLDERNRQSANARRKIEDPVVQKKNAFKAKKGTSGPDWFDIPSAALTPELKRDLQLIRMRSVLDPKRFYKKENTKAKTPDWVQVGRLVDGPTDFYSSRTPNRQRKQTFAEEILAGEQENGKLRKKYLEIQAAKASGKKAHYKARMTKRYGKKFKG